MQESEVEQFGAIITALSSVFRVDLTSETVDGYFEGLKDLTLSQVECAATSIIKTRTNHFFPTVGEMRAQIIGTLEERAQLSWGDCLDKIGLLDKTFDDPLTEKVLRIAFGSIAGFYARGFASEMSDRKHFLETYKSLANRQVVTNLLLEGKIVKKLKKGE